MLRRARVCGRCMVLAVLGLSAGAIADAQLPEKFTNLQYFPKDIQREELIQTMRGFSFSLGVRCEYCHAGKPEEHDKTDYASDEKDSKKAARAMLRMVDAINQEYIAKLGTQTQNRVACVTCHHGLGKPKGIAPTL